jgi:TnpA family transposase
MIMIILAGILNERKSKTTILHPIVLEGLLTQETGLHPKELMTDTASYSDVIFGLFHVLGYQFCPRLADMGESPFRRRFPGLTKCNLCSQLARHP